MSKASISNNPIVKRIYVFIPDNTLLSPMSPGVGVEGSSWSDHDVLRNSRGHALLSGTTIAGNCRHALSHAGVNHADICHLFGDSMGHGGSPGAEQSRLWVMESEIKGMNAMIRDGVALDENKQAIDKRKYDFEIVDTGATFDLRFELLIRRNDQPEDQKNDFAQSLGYKSEVTFMTMLALLRDGDIRFGAKTSRGYGRIRTSFDRAQILVCDFDADPQASRKWISFRWPQIDSESMAMQKDWGMLSDYCDISRWPSSSRYSRMKVELDLVSSILIRSKDNDAVGDFVKNKLLTGDYVSQIHSGTTAIIPGTSWAGAFRSQISKILIDLAASCGFEDPALIAQNLVNELFGTASDDSSLGDRDLTRASLICFEESSLLASHEYEGGYILTTRTSINRFTGGATRGALFTTLPWYRGITELDIRYPKDERWVEELLMIVIQDIDDGLISIGGESGIGRGVFRCNRITVDGDIRKISASYPAIARVLLDEASKKGGES